MIENHERIKQLVFALNTIEGISDIPENKRNDAEYMRGVLVSIHAEAQAVLNGKLPAFYRLTATNQPYRV